MPPLTRFLLLAGCWIGAALRFNAFFANSFHADEALFAGWARLIAVWRDPLLLTQAVDKPPLLFYLQALAYPLLGPVEWAARLPNFIASLLLIPLTGVLAWRVFRDSTTAVVAALLVALAPLTIQFSATAFSDPLLTFWLMMALVFTVEPAPPKSGHRLSSPLLAGLFFGLAVATKYQALLFLPLLVAFGLYGSWRSRDWRRSVGGLLLAVIPLGFWMGVRTGSTSVVALQWANIGGLRPAWSWEVWPRLAAQARLWRLALGGSLLWVGLAIVVTLAPTRKYWTSRATPPDGFIALFVLAYCLLHWLWAVPVWDRYLVPILPLVAILIGRGLSWLRTAGEHLIPLRPRARTLQRASIAIVVLLVVVHLPLAMAARDGRFPIGGRPDADGGAAGIARLLADAPYGTVLYDHWYSWHWRYQLFDKRVYVSWFPHVDALLEDMAVFAGSGPPRYIVLPASKTAGPVKRRLAAAGYRLDSISDETHSKTMTLYRIEPREDG